MEACRCIFERHRTRQTVIRGLIWSRVIDEILQGKTCWRNWSRYQQPVEPDAYLAWVEKMSRTHEQEQCRDCGLWHVWKEKHDLPQDSRILDLPSSDVSLYVGLSIDAPVATRSLRERA